MKFIDNFIRSIKYPAEAPRTQRSLEFYAILKTNEYRSLIFYALAFALKEVMTPKCFNHIMKYIIFLRILNQEYIKPNDLKFARILCDEFMIEFKDIYGKKSQTFNFHCHQHLVDQVENTGSLGNINGFPFEGWFFNTKCIPAGTRPGSSCKS